MKAFLLLAILSTVICVSVSASAAIWYVDGSVSSSGDGASWETALKTIQEGINGSSDGDTVVVAEGTYAENIAFNGKNIVLTSTDPSDPDVVAETIIDGKRRSSVVAFAGTEDETCVLQGFTIRGGRAELGAGVSGGPSGAHTRATIQHNVVSGNVARNGGGIARCDGMIRWNTVAENAASGDTPGGRGGGLQSCNGTIENNVITLNSADWVGGGLSDCHGSIRANTISGNTAEGAAGLCMCDGTIENNLITQNSTTWLGGGGLSACNGLVRLNRVIQNRAEGVGGGFIGCGGSIVNNLIVANEAYGGAGLYECPGIIQGNTISRNVARSYDGGGLHDCDGTVRDNLIWANRTERSGGGLHDCKGIILNNTIYGNSARDNGGGLAECGGFALIENCIIWGNTATDGQIYESSEPWYSCIQDWAGGGQGNIGSSPLFLDAGEGDFRLLASSPCIDAGDNGVPNLSETDIVGMHRIMFGGKSLTVDMGAYEFHIWAPTENSQTGEITLKWSSLAGKTYSVYHSSGMVSWDILTDNVPSAGDTVTTWIDSLGPVLPPGVRIRYYKVVENQ